jgi:hypothetical protein
MGCCEESWEVSTHKRQPKNHYKATSHCDTMAVEETPMPYTQDELNFYWRVAKGEATQDPRDTTYVEFIADTELEQTMVLDKARPYSDHDDVVTAIDARRTRENPDARRGLWQQT